MLPVFLTWNFSFIFISTSYSQFYFRFLWRVLNSSVQPYVTLDRFFLSGLGFRCVKKSYSSIYLNLGMSHVFTYSTASTNILSLLFSKTQFFLLSKQNQHQIFTYLVERFQPLFRYKRRGVIPNLNDWGSIIRPNKRLSTQR